MKKLKNIYLAFSGSEERGELGSISEASKAQEEFQELLEQLPQDMALKIESAYGGGTLSYEMQGFIYGFRYAVELMVECISKGDTASIKGWSM